MGLDESQGLVGEFDGGLVCLGEAMLCTAPGPKRKTASPNCSPPPQRVQRTSAGSGRSGEDSLQDPSTVLPPCLQQAVPVQVRGLGKAHRGHRGTVLRRDALRLSGDGCMHGCVDRWMDASCGHRILFQAKSFLTFPLPWLWHFVFWDCCPNRIRSFLFFKSPFEYFLDVIHAKRTDCRTGDAAKEANPLGRGWGLGAWAWSCDRAQSNFRSPRDLSSPVELRGKHPDHSGDPVDLYDVCDRLQNIEVEE